MSLARGYEAPAGTTSAGVEGAGASGSSAAERSVRRLLDEAGIVVGGNRPFDLRVHDRRFYGKVLTQETLGLGESYIDGWWDCDAIDELVSRLVLAEVEDRVRKDLATSLSILRLRLLNLQSTRRAAEVAKAHYDLGNDLFAAMLGPSMTYSCGYWPRASTLEEAQEHKHELICEKLGLGAGDRLLDIGCGWGTLVRHAASRRGASAVGITVSEEQQRYASTALAGLPVEVLLSDYRADAVGRAGPYTKVASVGMFEHVGTRNYRTFMERVHGLLPDGGLFLLHTIGNHPTTGADLFVERYLFPNSVLPSITDLARAVEGLFVVEDWHSFGADYDRTLMAWHENFERHAHGPGYSLGRRFYRMWRFYLLSFAGAFRSRAKMQLWQVVLSKGGVKGGYRSIR